MYDLSTSPSGPLGQAGQANSSTMPQGIFSNGPALSLGNSGNPMFNSDSNSKGMNGPMAGILSKFMGGQMPNAPQMGMQQGSQGQMPPGGFMGRMPPGMPPGMPTPQSMGWGSNDTYRGMPPQMMNRQPGSMPNAQNLMGNSGSTGSGMPQGGMQGGPSRGVLSNFMQR